jgi:hypothetical protein
MSWRDGGAGGRLLGSMGSCKAFVFELVQGQPKKLSHAFRIKRPVRAEDPTSHASPPYL